MQFKIRLAIFCLCVLTGQVFAQKPDYSGTWILNLEKSKIEANWAKGLTKGVFTIVQEGDKFSLSRYFIIEGKKKKLHIQMLADGKVRRKKLLFKGKLEEKDNGLEASIFRNGFKNIVNYRFGDSQQELVADEVFTGRPQDYHNHWVFHRSLEK